MSKRFSSRSLHYCKSSLRTSVGISEPNEDVDGREANMTDDWHESMENIPEQYQYMLEHDILTDCTFVVGTEDGETREFKAHRVQVARASVVFEAMLLRGEMIEAKTGHVRVTDLSPHTFQLLLSSIYGKKPQTKSFQEEQDLAFAAHKYQMKALLETCVSRMAALISPANIWSAIQTADLLQERLLEESCFEVLQHDTLRCITDAGFMQASEESVALLLEQDELNVVDELSLVNSIVHWARHAARQRGLSDDDSGVRAVLEPRLLSLFRLLAMSPQQFMLGPGLAGWLTKHEKAAISECLRSKDFSELPQHLSCVAETRKPVQICDSEPSGNFICRRYPIQSGRNVRQIEDITCCLKSRSKKWAKIYKCAHAQLLFTVHESSCKLTGFQCPSRCQSVDSLVLPANDQVYRENIVATTYTLQPSSTETKKITCGHTINHGKIEYNTTASVMFNEPIPLVPGTWYALEVVFRHHNRDGPAGEYPNPARDRSVPTATGVEFLFHTEQMEGHYNSENEGIFKSLIFSM